MLPVKRVLCPIDFSEPSREAFNVAVELASHFAAGLCLVHVVPVLPALPNDPTYVFKVPEYERLLHADADEKLRQLGREATSRGITVHTTVGHGEAAREIVRIADEENADLIVMATHGMTGWRHVMFGSVAERVVRLAKCPVLTTRAHLQFQAQ